MTIENKVINVLSFCFTISIVIITASLAICVVAYAVHYALNLF